MADPGHWLLAETVIKRGIGLSDAQVLYATITEDESRFRWGGCRFVRQSPGGGDAPVGE